MPVRMMHVRHMGMLVQHRTVNMPVRMRFSGRGIW